MKVKGYKVYFEADDYKLAKELLDKHVVIHADVTGPFGENEGAHVTGMDVDYADNIENYEGLEGKGWDDLDDEEKEWFDGEDDFEQLNPFWADGIVCIDKDLGQSGINWCDWEMIYADLWIEKEDYDKVNKVHVVHYDMEVESTKQRRTSMLLSEAKEILKKNGYRLVEDAYTDAMDAEDDERLRNVQIKSKINELVELLKGTNYFYKNRLEMKTDEGYFIVGLGEKCGVTFRVRWTGYQWYVKILLKIDDKFVKLNYGNDLFDFIEDFATEWKEVKADIDYTINYKNKAKTRLGRFTNTFRDKPFDDLEEAKEILQKNGYCIVEDTAREHREYWQWKLEFKKALKKLSPKINVLEMKGYIKNALDLEILGRECLYHYKHGSTPEEYAKLVLEWFNQAWDREG